MPAAPTLTRLDADPGSFVYSQALFYRHRSEQHPLGDRVCDIVDAALTDLWIAFRARPDLTSAAALVADGPASYWGVDLAAVALPKGNVSELEDFLNEEARWFLGLKSDLGRLCAWVIMRAGERAGQVGDIE